MYTYEKLPKNAIGILPLQTATWPQNNLPNWTSDGIDHKKYTPKQHILSAFKTAILELWWQEGEQGELC